jgi:hypothetical protein
MDLMQCITLSWENAEPAFLLFDSKNNCIEKLPLVGYVNINKGEKKYCKGYYDLLARSFKPCPNYPVVMDNKYSQCKKCDSLSGFSQCLGCNGYSCNSFNETAKIFCNQEHCVYLAYFEKGIIKVGTAVWYRRFERLLEQGALYSFFIARTPDGRIARKIEYDIGQRGIVSRVSEAKKNKNIIITEEKNNIHKLLIDTYHNLLSSLNQNMLHYFIKPAPTINNYLYLSNKIKEHFIDNTYQMTLFDFPAEVQYKVVDTIVNPQIIQGEVLSVIGNIVTLFNNEITSVVSTKKMYGWEVTIE